MNPFDASVPDLKEIADEIIRRYVVGSVFGVTVVINPRLAPGEWKFVQAGAEVRV